MHKNRMVELLVRGEHAVALPRRQSTLPRIDNPAKLFSRSSPKRQSAYGSRFFHRKIGRSEGRTKIFGSRCRRRPDCCVARRRRGERKKLPASDLPIFCENLGTRGLVA